VFDITDLVGYTVICRHGLVNNVSAKCVNRLNEACKVKFKSSDGGPEEWPQGASRGVEN